MTTTTYGLPMSCLHCGGTLHHVTGSQPIAGSECQAIARCERCGRQWQVIVHMRHVEVQRTEDKRQSRLRRQVDA